MKTPESVTPAIYTHIVRGEVADAELLTHRLIAGQIPAFVIENAGVSMARAADNTGLVTTLRANGFKGNIRNYVGFGAEIREVLPQDLSSVSIPEGVGWHWAGVTSLHADKKNDERGECYSLNFTAEGVGEFRMHENRQTEIKLEDLFSVLDSQTGQLLWHGLVDPELISPEGYITELEAGDLLVFDPSYVHMSRALTFPRRAQATFFNKRRRAA